MSEYLPRDTLARAGDVVTAPPSATTAFTVRDDIDRSFELPTGLYVGTVALYLGFLAVMTLAFHNPSLAIPMAVIVFSVVAGFAVPTLWVRMNPQNRQRALSYGGLKSRGIMTASGPLSAGSAAVQVLLLPVLVFAWGLAVAVIAALT